MSTGLVNLNQTQAAVKKLFGKAHTSALKGVANESIGSGVPSSTSTIFGRAIPNDPGSSPSLYDTASNSGGHVVLERVRLTLTSIAGTNYDADSLSNSDLEIAGAGTTNSSIFLDAGTGTSAAGPHGYIASLPSDYESNSNNPKAGSGNFVNGFNFTASLGTVQVVNTSFSTLDPNPYTPSLYESDNTAIPTTSPIDWLLDTYAGVLFVQDYNSGVVPGYIDAWLYIGDMASEVTSSASIPEGTISSSAQVIQSLPDGTVSGSSQINYTLITNIPAGIISSSNQITITTSSITNFDTEVSRSVVEAGFSSGDITSVIAGLGLSGGANSGAATLILDTSSQHFINAVNALTGSGGSGIFAQTGSVFSTTNNLQITGSLTIGDGLLKLKQSDALPTAEAGSIAYSGDEFYLGFNT